MRPMRDPERAAEGSDRRGRGVKDQRVESGKPSTRYNRCRGLRRDTRLSYQEIRNAEREKGGGTESNRTATALLVAVTRVTRRLLFDCTAPPVWLASSPFVGVSMSERVRAFVTYILRPGASSL